MTDTLDTVETHGTTSMRDGNTKNSSRAWFFTWNNFEKNDIEWLKTQFSDEKYVFQEEKGEKTQTTHLQGVIYFRNARSFNSMRNLHNQIHWERCRSVRDAVKYCQKSDTACGGRWAQGYKINTRAPILCPMAGLKLKDWQLEIISIIAEKPDCRKIYWYWDAIGGTGKSVFTTYLYDKYNACVVGGKKADIGYIFKNEYAKRDIKTVVIDLPRSTDVDANFDAIESLKNGLMICPKYESSVLRFNPVHVIIFANKAPDMHMLSADRWIVKKILY